MNIKYSIVIPIFNEFDSILPLHKSICDVMNRLPGSYEIIFVNDGSSPKNLDFFISEIDKNITRIVSLDRHYGQTKALVYGFSEARGEFVISLDGDMQDDPEYIPYFMEKLYQGFDVVCGYRIKRIASKNMILLSKAGNFIQKIFFHTGLNDISCTYRIYKRECIENLKLIRNGYHRYIPFLLIKRGYKVTEIAIEQRERIYGNSNYNFWKIFQIIFNFFVLIFDIFMKKV